MHPTRPSVGLALLLSLVGHALLVLALCLAPSGTPPHEPVSVTGVRVEEQAFLLKEDCHPSPHPLVEDIAVTLTEPPVYPDSARPASSPTAPRATTPNRTETTRPPNGEPGHSGAVESGVGRRLFPSLGAGRSVVFVIDRSLSMGINGALPAACRAVLDMLPHLAPGVQFQIVLYNRRAEPLSLRGRPMLAPVNAETLRQATQALQNLDATGRTDHIEALRRALRFEPDLLYLVTDAGDLSDPEAQEICRLNARLTRGHTAIHTIELNRRPERSDNPLQRVAVLNHGTYRHLAPTP